MRDTPSLVVFCECGRYGLRTKPTPDSSATASNDDAGTDTRIRLFDCASTFPPRAANDDVSSEADAFAKVWNQDNDDPILFIAARLARSRRCQRPQRTLYLGRAVGSVRGEIYVLPPDRYVAKDA